MHLSAHMHSCIMHWGYLYVSLIITMFINDFLSEVSILYTVLYVTSGWTAPSTVKLLQSLHAVEDHPDHKSVRGRIMNPYIKLCTSTDLGGQLCRNSCYPPFCLPLTVAHGFVNTHGRILRHHQGFSLGDGWAT